MKKSICLFLCGWIIGIITALLFKNVYFKDAQQNSQEILEVDSCAIDYNDPYYSSDDFKEKMTMGVGGSAD